MRFLFGVAVGVGLAWLARSKYAEDLRVEQRMADMQKRADAVLITSRRVLDEARQELKAATEAGRASLQHKAETMRMAVEHPEVVEEKYAAEEKREAEQGRRRE